MSDLIDRQAAIEKYGNWYVEEGTEEGFISDMKHFLEMLPSAEPERKHGKWVNYGTECSECGYHRIDQACQSSKPFEYNYCPNCGADMRESE